jgi:uncharacterized cupin superfamily protein
MSPEARLEDTGGGLAPATEGWFVVNVRDSSWVTNEALGACCIFEGGEVPFAELGFTLAVLQPGQSGGRYHREGAQEDFLVLQGECLLLIEGEERHLRAWDFVHCPPWTEHAFVGAGDGLCLIFMTGRHTDPNALVYPRSELALKHGAGVETETTRAAEAYAPFPKWQPGKPDFTGMPWGE